MGFEFEAKPALEWIHPETGQANFPSQNSLIPYQIIKGVDNRIGRKASFQQLAKSYGRSLYSGNTGSFM